MRGSFIIIRRFTFARAGFVSSPSIFTTQLDAAAAPPSVVLPWYDAVVGTLLELHYYFNISKNHDDLKQLLTASKFALITCAAAGLTVFGGCSDIARGSKAFDFSVLYSILRVYSEYRVIFVL